MARWVTGENKIHRNHHRIEVIIVSMKSNFLASGSYLFSSRNVLDRFDRFFNAVGESFDKAVIVMADIQVIGLDKW